MLVDYLQRGLFRYSSVFSAMKITRIAFTYTQDALGHPTDTIRSVSLYSESAEGQPFAMTMVTEPASYYHKYKPEVGGYHLSDSNHERENNSYVSADKFEKNFRVLKSTSVSDLFDIHRNAILSQLSKAAALAERHPSLQQEAPELFLLLAEAGANLKRLNLYLANAK